MKVEQKGLVVDVFPSGLSGVGRMEACVFIGTHAAVLDEKSRLVMPAGFRKDNSEAVLGGDFYITPHQDGFLIARPAVVWEGYLQLIQVATELDGAQKRKFVRLLCNNSVKTRLDSQFRMVLSQVQRRKLAFDNLESRQKLLVVGCGDFIEVWPEARYRGEDDSTRELSGFINGFDGR
jgi:DNA-binding transcriptional regulator/RsmH inhibitor MraZ